MDYTVTQRRVLDHTSVEPPRQAATNVISSYSVTVSSRQIPHK